MASLHISISAEPIATIAGFHITNSIFTSFIVTALLILFFIGAGRSIKSTGKSSRLQSLVELIVETFRNMVHSIVESDKKVALFTPIIMAFFFFIIANNWFGLLPGVGSIGFTKPVESVVETTTEGTIVEAGVPIQSESVFVPYLRAGTADLNTTLALAIVSVLLTQIYGVSFQKLRYFTKFINFSNPVNFVVGLLEIVMEAAKILSFAFRLFGNIFAGEVLLAVMTFLIPLVIPMPFYGLEIFVGFIQALVFSMLSLMFFNLATIGHGEEH